MSANDAPWFQSNAPDLVGLIGSLLFQMGLIKIVLTGADLFTSNILFMTTAYLRRHVTIVDVLKNWFIFFGNFAGMLFIAAVITGHGGAFSEEVYKSEVFNFANKKAVQPQWHQIVLRAIRANWLAMVRQRWNSPQALFNARFGRLAGPLRRGEGSGHVLNGRDIDTEHPAAQLPQSGASMADVVSREPDQEKYGKSLAERSNDQSSEATV